MRISVIFSTNVHDDPHQLAVTVFCMLLLIMLLCVLIRPTRILEPEYVMVMMMRGTLDDLFKHD